MKKPEKAAKQTKPTSPVDYEQRIGELTEHLQRLQAEFENYKKRVASERGELMASAKVSVLMELLPALDNFDRAAAHLPEHLENDPWARGMSYVGEQLEKLLDDMGVKKFNPTGQEFDVSEHEALEFIESDKPEGIVLETVTPGYTVGGRVVRPATVKVSSGSFDNKAAEKSSKKEGEK